MLSDDSVIRKIGQHKYVATGAVIAAVLLLAWFVPGRPGIVGFAAVWIVFGVAWDALYHRNGKERFLLYELKYWTGFAVIIGVYALISHLRFGTGL